MKRSFKKTLGFFFSMRFAIGILLVLVIACTAGSVIPQGNSRDWYLANYSSRAAGAVLLFGLDDVFHSLWFIILTIILCLNLLGCNLLRFPSLIKRTRHGFDPSRRIKAILEQGECDALTKDPLRLFTSLRFRRPVMVTGDNGRACMYAAKNKIGMWGPWLTHLGMLIIIAAFALGQMTKKEYTVYGVPGQTKPVGDTGFELTIDSFEVDLREDDTVEQYTSHLTMTDLKSGKSSSGQAMVNHPLTLFGMKLYQNSTGWAAGVQVVRNGDVLQDEVICAGEYLQIKDNPDLTVMLSAFYPDYITGADGRPATASSRINNPAYLYRLYYQGNVLGMNVLTGDEVITVEDYEIRFKDPLSYTLIQVKRDPYTPLAALGGLILLTALILAFYLRTAELAAEEQENGEWKVKGRSRKGEGELAESIRRETNNVS